MKIVVIGSGAVGSMTAWHLSKLGLDISIIDPTLKNHLLPKKPFNGTTASLGVLMGNTFRRSKGRAWRLRQRSMELWKEWISELQLVDNKISIKTPLIQIAKSKEEFEIMKKMSLERNHLGIEILEERQEENLNYFFNNNYLKGIISHQDGRINPYDLYNNLLKLLDNDNVEKLNESVIMIKRNSLPNKTKWELILSNSSIVHADFIIICAALGSANLIKGLGHKCSIEPILGQVVEVETTKELANWPSVLNFQGINLIPNGHKRLLIGATLEKGYRPNNEFLENMLDMNGHAPNWIKNAKILNQWYGIRGKPSESPAPLIEELEAGLILATAHYRNGILLSTATAELVANKIKLSIT